MSKQAIRNRKAMPTRRELRDELNTRELASDYRNGMRLSEIGRVYR